MRGLWKYHHADAVSERAAEDPSGDGERGTGEEGPGAGREGTAGGTGPSEQYGRSASGYTCFPEFRGGDLKPHYQHAEGRCRSGQGSERAGGRAFRTPGTGHGRAPHPFIYADGESERCRREAGRAARDRGPHPDHPGSDHREAADADRDRESAAEPSYGGAGPAEADR